MRFLARVLVGLGVSFLALCCLAGGVVEAGIVLGASIICTAGISLVVWIPLWWGVGAFVLMLVDLFRQQEEAIRPDQPAHPERTSEAPQADWSEQALLRYIRQARAAGVHPDIIKLRLQSAGWSKAEIQKAQDSVSPI